MRSEPRQKNAFKGPVGSSKARVPPTGQTGSEPAPQASGMLVRRASASTVVDAARCAVKGPVLGWTNANERPGRPVKTQEMNDTLETSLYTGRLREGSIAPLGRS